MVKISIQYGLLRSKNYCLVDLRLRKKPTLKMPTINLVVTCEVSSNIFQPIGNCEEYRRTQ